MKPELSRFVEEYKEPDDLPKERKEKEKKEDELELKLNTVCEELFKNTQKVTKPRTRRIADFGYDLA